MSKAGCPSAHLLIQRADTESGVVMGQVPMQLIGHDYRLGELKRYPGR